MPTGPIDRRTFISTGATVCGLCVCSQFPFAAFAGDETIDPKKLECCIECDELEACDKDLWKRFPKFHQQVVEMQAKYRAQA